MSQVAILVACHKPSEVATGAAYLPLEVAAALREQHFGMQRDDDGDDNISAKNASYCELTGVYWAWKNLDADYYGSFHYRRYLNFDENMVGGLSSVVFPTLDAAQRSVKIDSGDTAQLLERYDVLVPRKTEMVRNGAVESIYDYYKACHNIRDLDFVASVVRAEYPAIAKFLPVLHETDGYFFNMFVMRKDIFEEYCEFVFAVLGRFEREVDISNYDARQSRVMGFLGERLTNVFVRYIQSSGKFRVGELQSVVIENTDPPEPPLTPAAASNNVPIVIPCDDQSIPFASTLIHSILKAGSADTMYDVLIIGHGGTNESARRVIKEFSDVPNVNVRFRAVAGDADGFMDRANFWLRLSEALSAYDKVIYLHYDTIVKSDVADLFGTDVSGVVLAAARDAESAGLYNGAHPKGEFWVETAFSAEYPEWKRHLDEVLGMKQPFDYFQDGVMVLNVGELRECLRSAQSSQLSDYRGVGCQDFLNKLAQGRVKFLDMAWNVLSDTRSVRVANIIARAPREMYQDYLGARDIPKIIHFAGEEEPWIALESDFADEFWPFARQSSFYEVILDRAVAHRPRAMIEEFRRENDEFHAAHELRPTLARGVKDVVGVVAPQGTSRRLVVANVAAAVRKSLGKLGLR